MRALSKRALKRPRCMLVFTVRSQLEKLHCLHTAAQLTPPRESVSVCVPWYVCLRRCCVRDKSYAMLSSCPLPFPHIAAICI